MVFIEENSISKVFTPNQKVPGSPGDEWAFGSGFRQGIPEKQVLRVCAAVSTGKYCSLILIPNV